MLNPVLPNLSHLSPTENLILFDYPCGQHTNSNTTLLFDQITQQQQPKTRVSKPNRVLNNPRVVVQPTRSKKKKSTFRIYTTFLPNSCSR